MPYTPVVNGYEMQGKNMPISNLKIVTTLLYNQFLIDRDSSSNIVGYFMMLLLDEYIRISREN